MPPVFQGASSGVLPRSVDDICRHFSAKRLVIDEEAMLALAPGVVVTAPIVERPRDETPGEVPAVPPTTFSVAGSTQRVGGAPLVDRPSIDTAAAPIEGATTGSLVHPCRCRFGEELKYGEGLRLRPGTVGTGMTACTATAQSAHLNLVREFASVELL